MAWVEELIELEIRYKNGKELKDKELRRAIMETREIVCDKTNNTCIPIYNDLEDQLGIDIPNERMQCDDVAYLTLFNTAWTCELIHRGYNVRVLDEHFLSPDYRRKHEFLARFKKDLLGKAVITIEEM